MSAQDAQAQHGIDVEAEIMAALAQEITAEIAKILRDKPPTNKFRKAIKKRELDVLHKHLSKNGMKKEAIYRHLANFQGVEPESMKREFMRRRKKVTKK